MKVVFVRQQGFSLLEMLVAFAIVGISLGLIYRSLGSTVRTTAEMALFQQATLLGNSLLSMYDDVPPNGVKQTGQRGVFRWEISSNVYSQSLVPLKASSQETSVVLHEVFFLIQWDQRGQVKDWRFSTLLPQRALPAGVTK